MSGTYQCKNCEKSFDPSFEYCPYCGQEMADKLTFGVLFRNTISNYFSIDARFFKSFIPLITKPGALARRFVDGKRLSYLHPAKFYVFVSVVFFFIFSFTVQKVDNKVSETLYNDLYKELALDSLAATMDSMDIQVTASALKENQADSGMSDKEIEALDSVITDNQYIPGTTWKFQKKLLDSLIANGAPQVEKLKAMGIKEGSGAFVSKIYIQLLKLYEQRGGGILKALYDTIPIAMFFMLPLFALLLKLFYYKSGTFAHHLVFSFYFFTFIFTTFCVLILANTFLELSISIYSLVFFSFILYLMLALRHFYKSHWRGAFFKANIISFIYMIIILPIAMAGVVFVSFMLY